jgi:hypothetical protein
MTHVGFSKTVGKKRPEVESGKTPFFSNYSSYLCATMLISKATY